MKTLESEEQQALIQWSELQFNIYPELKLLHHIPNGGMRNISVAKKLKKEGVKAGVPDLFLPVARKGFHGLYIEMKSKNGKTSIDQDWWIDNLKKQGYCVEVCYQWEHAKDIILKYLK